MIHLLLLLTLILAFGEPSLAQDITMLGGDLTSTIPGRNAIQVTAPNVSDQDKITTQLLGFAPFHRRFTKRDGLGPLFINNACGGCHVDNGRGPVRIRDRARRMNSMVVKVSLQGLNDDGSPINVPGIGEQLQDRTVKGKSLYRMRLRWRKKRGNYPDGTEYVLYKPKLTFRIPGFKRKAIASSLRMSPILIGMGLLEAIPESTVLALSDPEDLDNDGISGKPQYVPDAIQGGMSLGRFGHRASNPSVEQQTGGAAINDMGISNPVFNPDPEREIELPALDFERLVLYQELAGVPIAQRQDDTDVIRGKELFQQIGCHHCHVITVVTEHEDHPELTGQTIHPFTDLLLHDMGPELADDRAEFSASGAEWRTAPLWGVGFSETVSRVKPRYLHDGRARTVEEAILWHGGEAEASKLAFMELSKEDREAVIAFLRSL